MATKTNPTRPLTITLLLMAACARQEATPTSTERSARALLPASYHASVVSDTIPLAMHPGERLNLEVVMANDGTAGWPAHSVTLYSENAPQLFNGVAEANAIAAGSNATFDIVANAPYTESANATFSSAMYLDDGLGTSGWFGPLTISGINVSALNPRRWSCAMVSSTLPLTLSPGASASGTIVVQNNGTGTWQSSGLCLYDMDSGTGQWGAGAICNPLTAAVSPNQTATFNYQIKAPTTPGTYTFLRQMFDGNATSPSGGVGMFDLDPAHACVNLAIVVQGGAFEDAAVVSQNFPSTMIVNTTSQISVTMLNTGTQTWTNDSHFMLYNHNTASWGLPESYLLNTTAAGQQATFSFTISAPGTTGSYHHQWQMFDDTIGFFGAPIDVPVTVTPVLPALDANVVSQSIPQRIDPNAIVVFNITMKNTGSSPWSAAGGEALWSVNNPLRLWTTAFTALKPTDLVLPGQTYTFSFLAMAPSTPGVYSSSWQMSQAGAAGNFGQVASTPSIYVTYCGNGITEPQHGETCDDGNLVDGDGCSSTCQIEPRAADLATARSDRQLLGSQASGQLSNVAIGDVDGDGIADLLSAETTPNYYAFRNSPPSNAGVIHGHLGSAAFFDRTSSIAYTTQDFQIYGPNAGANLGSGMSGSLISGDVTGDGIADIIAGAPGFNYGGARPGCGAVYVIAGGPGLAQAGWVNLAANPLPSSVALVITGAAAGDSLRVLGIGDINGDGVKDVIVGAPGSANGTGAVYVIRGGITGTVDLALAYDPRILAIVIGSAQGDSLGETVAAAGDINGDGIVDLAVSSPRASPGGNPGAGAVWALFGPVFGTHNLASGQFSAAVYGEWNYDGLGQSVAIGQVQGSPVGDLVIGVRDGWNDTTNMLCGYVDVWTGPMALGVQNLSTGAMPSTRIYGRSVHSLLGNAIALGDLNHDGFMDIVASAPDANGPNGDRPQAGEITVVLGAQSMGAVIDLAAVSSPAFRAYGPSWYGLSGEMPFNVAVGDLDGDGRADIAVGTPLAGPSSQAGQIDLYRTRW